MLSWLTSLQLVYSHYAACVSRPDATHSWRWTLPCRWDELRPTGGHDRRTSDDRRRRSNGEPSCQRTPSPPSLRKRKRRWHVLRVQPAPAAVRTAGRCEGTTHERGRPGRQSPAPSSRHWRPGTGHRRRELRQPGVVDLQTPPAWTARIPLHVRALSAAAVWQLQSKVAQTVQ